jgi:polyisoprenoid-binding protein YceI
MKNTIVKQCFNVAALALAIALSSTPVSAEVASAGSYKIDPDHTTVLFTVSHLGTSNLVGRFNSVAGNLSLDPKGDSRVEVTIQTDSVDTNHEKRDVHLRGPDFFNAKQYPVMKFVSTKVSYNSEGEPVSVTGKLSLHGDTQSVTLDVKPVGAGNDPWGGYRAGYDATTTIKRSAFGMNFMPGGIGDDISINLNIEAIKQ